MNPSKNFQHFAAAAAAALLAVGAAACSPMEVKPIEVKPITITIDVNVRSDDGTIEQTVSPARGPAESTRTAAGDADRRGRN